MKRARSRCAGAGRSVGGGHQSEHHCLEILFPNVGGLGRVIETRNGRLAVNQGIALFTGIGQQLLQPGIVIGCETNRAIPVDRHAHSALRS
jgi:hypothetical protein